MEYLIQIQLINTSGAGTGNYELEILKFKKVLDEIKLLKPKGVTFNQLTNRWCIPSNLIEELMHKLNDCATFLEPITEKQFIKEAIGQMHQTNQNKFIITCINYSDKKIGINFSQYSKEIAEAMRGIKGANWEKPYWLINFSDYDNFKLLSKSFPEWQVVEKLDTVN